MKTKLLLILCALVSLNGIAQSNNVVKDDHLNPEEAIFDMYDHHVEYYSNIRSVLMKGLKENPTVRYVVVPSFDVEYLFQIDCDYQKNTYEIVVCRAKESIWDTKDKSKIRVETWHNSLSKDDADLIITLFRRAVAGVKNPEVSLDKKSIHEARLDGTNHFFSCRELTPMGVRTGVTWSPPAGSKMERLVNLSDRITEWAKGNKGTVVLPDELKTVIVSMTNELKNSAN